jgi:hypothetical protein
MKKGIKHQVWINSEGLTGVCFASSKGDDYRKLMEKNSRLIHTFYASSHFEAMTVYYAYMNWGKYEAIYEKDKELYDELKK